jgi:hypothetical protein
LLECQEARADHWVRDGNFETGTFLVCAINEGTIVMCVLAITDGSDTEADNHVSTMNQEPMNTPGDTLWWKWNGKDLEPYKMPCRFIKGTTM